MTYFSKALSRETTKQEAMAEVGELLAQAHELICWPVQAQPLRTLAKTIQAEVAAL